MRAASCSSSASVHDASPVQWASPHKTATNVGVSKHCLSQASAEEILASEDCSDVEVSWGWGLWAFGVEELFNISFEFFKLDV